MKKAYNPENAILNEEERWYEGHYEEFVAENPDERKLLIEAVKNQPRIVSEKKQMVSIRLDPTDVRAIKEKAERAGLAYQTLISSLLHQYALGDLVNIEEARRLLKK
jgi:predicted DNA binding CopG/RHH family protein